MVNGTVKRIGAAIAERFTGAGATPHVGDLDHTQAATDAEGFLTRRWHGVARLVGDFAAEVRPAGVADVLVKRGSGASVRTLTGDRAGPS